MENIQPYEPLSSARNAKNPVSKNTSLALAALMAITPAATTYGQMEPFHPHNTETKGNKVEIFKNVTVQAIGPSFIDGQKRYQEIAILAGGDPKTHSGTLTVRVVKEMGTDQEHTGQLTRGADGNYWFTSQKTGKTIYPDVPSDGNGEQ